MGGIWVHGELAGDGSLARISTEVATLARALGAASGEPVTGVVVGAAPEAAADDAADDAGLAVLARRAAAVVQQLGLVQQRCPDGVTVGLAVR